MRTSTEGVGLAAAAAALMVAALPQTAAAQGYPTKPILVAVSGAVGGISDIKRDNAK